MSFPSNTIFIQNGLKWTNSQAANLNQFYGLVFVPSKEDHEFHELRGGSRQETHDKINRLRVAAVDKPFAYYALAVAGLNQPQEKEEPRMNNGINFANAAALVREDLTTFDGRHLEDASNKSYTYKVLRDLAAELKEGDLVLVQNSRGIRVVVVNKIHDEMQIDLDTNVVFRWAFQKVDTAKAKQLDQEDKFLLQKLNERKTSNVREQVRAALGLDGGSVTKYLEEARTIQTEE